MGRRDATSCLIVILAVACGSGDSVGGGAGAAAEGEGEGEGAVGAGATHAWTRSFDGHANGVALDGTGNVYVTGRVEDGSDLGGGALPAGALGGLLLASFTGSGTHRWSHSFSADGWERGQDVAVDGLDHLAVVGLYSHAVDLGGDPLPGTDDGAAALLVASFDADGVHRWSHGFVAGGTGGRFNDYGGYSLAADAAGNVYVVGELRAR